MIYLDNAATSFPKPPAVYAAADDFMRNVGASAGRSAHRRANKAGRIVLDSRERLAALFNVHDAARIVFTKNATEAINFVLLGILKQGDKVLVSSLEHNAVMRPLTFLRKERGVSATAVQAGPGGGHAIAKWETALHIIKPRLVVVNHGSNVTGCIAPIAAIGALCRMAGSLLLVDAAQTAGIVDIDVERDGIDFLAFSGHKGLFGLQGTGGLFIREGIEARPLMFGGTGSNSESVEQPAFLPDCCESGTLNGPGIAALGAGCAFVQAVGTRAIFHHGAALAGTLDAELRRLSRIRMFSLEKAGAALPTISFTAEGIDSAEIARRLDMEYDIAVRVGLHCAPAAHRTIGTFPAGTVRLSLGYFTTPADVEKTISAIKTIISS